MIDPALIKQMTLGEAERAAALNQWVKIEALEARASEKQLDFQRKFFDRSDNGRSLRAFVAIGGNRSGKSVLCGRMCFAKFLRDRGRDGDLYWSIAQNATRSIAGPQRELWLALPPSMFDREWSPDLGFGGRAMVLIKTKDGGRLKVEFRSSDQDPDTFETVALKGCWADENLSETIYRRLPARLVDHRGFFLYSDINNQAWPIDEFETALPEAGVHYQRFTIYDNQQNLPPGSIEEFAASLPEEEQRLRIWGEAGVMEGVVFKGFRDYGLPNSHVVDEYPLGIPLDWPRWRCIDFGESSPTACSWATVQPNEHICVYREHYSRGNSVFWNAKRIHELSGAVYREVQRPKDDLHEKPWTELVVEGGEQYVKTFLDPACFKSGGNNGSRITISQEYRDAGIICRPWPRINIMGEHAAVARFKKRLEVGTWRCFKTCVALRREMRIWKHAMDKDGKPLASDSYENANNHLIDGQKGFIATNPTHAQVNELLQVYG